MPPKNPGPMMGSRSGKLEMKNPPGTTHGGQQAPRLPMTDEEIARLAPEVGSIWTHRNKGLYQVVELLNCEGDDLEHRLKYPPAISYRSANGKKWTRRLDDWHRSMTREMVGPNKDIPATGNISQMAYLWACFRLNHSLKWSEPIHDRPEFGSFTFGFVTGRVVGYDHSKPQDRPEVVEWYNGGPTYYGNRAPKKLKVES